MQPLEITAYLQQGIVLDLRNRLPLDGILTSVVRSLKAAAAGLPGSELDGGLHGEEIQEWNLPLSRCEASSSWHWHCSGAWLLGPSGEAIQPLPDTHRLLVRLDESRASRVAIRLPKHAGGPRGRFRPRLTPVVSYPASAVRWRATGDRDEISELVNHLPAIGSRRGAGEGAVLSWQVAEVDVPESELDAFTHLRPDGRLSRPVPLECAKRLNAANWEEGHAGLRPPLFHRSRQEICAVPSFN